MGNVVFLILEKSDVMDLNNPSFILFFFVILYLIIFIVNYLINLRKVKKKKYESIGEMNYLINKFKLDKSKINYKKEIIFISLINSFIISGVGVFVTSLDIAMVLQLLIGFALLFALIYALYEIYGRHLGKKNGRD
jgi:uncharacterized ion transporter superfamily protein YfcC